MIMPSWKNWSKPQDSSKTQDSYMEPGEQIFLFTRLSQKTKDKYFPFLLLEVKQLWHAFHLSRLT
jgi:hypothetical protein